MPKKTKQVFKPQEYIVVNKQGEAYIGMMYGSFVWSNNWDEAKVLRKENTPVLLQYTPGAEIIEL